VDRGYSVSELRLAQEYRSRHLKPIARTCHLSLDPLLQCDRTYLYRWRTADVTAIIGCLDDKQRMQQGDL
jgi:hypothetical protein